MTPNERVAAADRVIAIALGVAIAAMVCFALTGCASVPSTSGAAFLAGVHDPGSNYEDGIGLRVEAMTDTPLRPVVRASVTNAFKTFADSGYTYAAAAGLRYGETWYAEGGYTVFGYASSVASATFDDNDSTSYWRIGYDATDWGVAATYYPVFGGKYETDELRVESRFAFGRLVLFVEPAFYRMTLPVAQERVSDVALRGGVGVRW